MLKIGTEVMFMDSMNEVIQGTIYDTHSDGKVYTINTSTNSLKLVPVERIQAIEEPSVVIPCTEEKLKDDHWDITRQICGG